MFTELPPAQTGIVTENRYADPRMWGDLNHEFEAGEIGTGVAIGDYDGDGRPDIFVVSKTEGCRLFRNLGGLKFEDVTEPAGVGDHGADASVWKQGATFADVNNDGRLDLYVCRFNAPNLLYINQGDGTFRQAAHAYGLDVTDASAMAAFCDYDRDGWLDVFVQTNLLDANAHPNGQRDYLFHNDRNGHFTNVTAAAGLAGETQGHAAIWWDFDGDGWPDLYVGNDFQAPDQLYRNNRDGTFTNVIAGVVPHTPYSSMGADLGDINNDGLVDFIIADMAATSHEQDQRGMADSRARNRDLAPAAGTVPQYERNAVYLNTGTGRCLEAAWLLGLAATDWSWSPRFEDLDNDGRLDLFVTNGMDREATNVDLLSRQMGAQSAAERIRVIRNSPVLAERNLAFRNEGDLRFRDVSAAWGLDQRGVSFGSAFGDLDGDGDLDVVYTNYQHGITVLRNDCATGHRAEFALHGTRSNKFGVGATVRVESPLGLQVRQLVLARGVLSSSEPILQFGFGDDEVIRRVIVTWPGGATQEFANLPVDRRYTITEPDAAPENHSPAPPAPAPLFTEFGDAIHVAVGTEEDVVDETAGQRLMPVRLNRRGPALAVGDLNGDGIDDIVIGGTTRTPRRILFGSLAAGFSVAAHAAPGTTGPVDDGPLLVFDAEGNGANALLVTRGGSVLPGGSPEYQPALFLNDGRGHLRPAPADALPPEPICAGAAAAADFDRDGRVDVFIGARLQPGDYPLAPASALLRNEGGRFADVTDTVAPALRNAGMVTSALWSDVDGDGWPDLLLTLDWGGVKCFHNDHGTAFTDWSEKLGFAAAGTGWWTSLAAADFNGDGHMDYVAGNVGLNTPYHASPAEPAVLFYGSFAGEDARPELVEGYYEQGRLFPWRSRHDLGAVIPAVLRRFPSNNAYARATLPEILGADRLAAAAKFTATEFRSGVFLSRPDGTYSFQPLPRVAQVAPPQAIVAGDFDGDGHADIYAVQNSQAPIPSVGRFDGGLSQLLKGDGRGNFTAVPPVESGLIVPGDATALVVADLDHDGRPDFLVSRNSATTLAFRNAGPPARRN
ncbi:MAG TPA: FG-GAP-like repeat-containing protein [Opitutus sp.]|nr:FG-GAP-like repeat-containing protein [Opitutus sp.]